MSLQVSVSSCPARGPVLRRRSGTCCLALLFLLGAPAAAQREPPSPPPTQATGVEGYVFDTASGVPLVGGRVCVWLEPARNVLTTPCGTIDGGGRYQLVAVPPGRRLVTVGCRSRLSVAYALRQDSVEFAEGRILRRDLGVGLQAHCLTTTPVEIRGEFRGHFSYGFEMSEFVACGDTAAVWIEMPDAMWREIKWPRGEPGEDYPRVYVRWRGTRRGPGAYGHMGAAAYELVVDRVLEVRRPRRGDCRSE